MDLSYVKYPQKDALAVGETHTSTPLASRHGSCLVFLLCLGDELVNMIVCFLGHLLTLWTLLVRQGW